MAKKFKKIGSIKETEGGNFGNYSEGNGGGTPRGGVWGGANGRKGWDNRKNTENMPEGAHRESQARTSDGKFTYNSVNGKELSSNSDPTRGKTVNPLLTGGKNGVYIDQSTYAHDVKDSNGNIIHKKGDLIKNSQVNVKEQFKTKQGSIYDTYKDKWYQKGSEKITKEGKKYVTKLSSADIWEISTRGFDIKTGMFKGEQEVFAQSKSGKPTQAEYAAKRFAKKTGQEQYVKTDTGAIVKFKDIDSAKKMNQKLQTMATGTTQLKHSPAQIKAVRDAALKAGYDLSQYTDEQIDQIADDYLNL